jgi:hypothetical protein
LAETHDYAVICGRTIRIAVDIERDVELPVEVGLEPPNESWAAVAVEYSSRSAPTDLGFPAHQVAAAGSDRLWPPFAIGGRAHQALQLGDASQLVTWRLVRSGKRYGIPGEEGVEVNEAAVATNGVPGPGLLHHAAAGTSSPGIGVALPGPKRSATTRGGNSTVGNTFLGMHVVEHDPPRLYGSIPAYPQAVVLAPSGKVGRVGGAP